MEALKKILIIMLIAVFTLQFTYTLINEIAFGNSSDFAIRSYYARSSAGTSNIYPGSRRVYLKIEVEYQNSIASATMVFGRLIIEHEGISFSSGSDISSPARFNGSVVREVSFGMVVTFEYLLDFSESLPQGDHALTLNITYLRGTTQLYDLHSNEIKINVSPYPEISLRVVDSYFSPAAYPGSVDTNLYVVLENNGSTINSAYFKLTSLNGFTVKNPRASTGLVNKGERFTLTFTGISIPSNASVGTYTAVIFADCSARTEDDVTYSKNTTLTASVNVEAPPPEEPVMLAFVNTLYNGEPSPLLPSARGVVLRIYLVNRLPEAINTMIVNATFPEGITLRAISGTYINGMTAGGTCFVDLTVDVSPNMNLTKRNGILDIIYFKIVGGSSFPMNQTVFFPINIESPHSHISELTLVEAYWGSPDPAPVYSTSRYVPLTLRFANKGRYPVWGVTVNAFSQHLTPIKDSEVCATTVASGGSCTAILYFDINTTSPTVTVKVSASYLFTEFGTHISLVRNFTTFLPVENYPASESVLSLISAGWQNNFNVFPKTSNTTYQVTLANRAPYSLGGINLKFKLPYGITSKGQSEATAYIEGPVRSLATFTASFTISVGDVPPGSYNANLTVDCILLSGGPGVRCVEEFDVQIMVNDDNSALEHVETRWYEGSVGPYTYGAHLMIMVRNVYVDGLRGVVLELELPNGFRNAVNNSTRVKTPPLSVQLPQQLQTLDLTEILNAFLSAQYANPTQTYSRGDILTFMASLNIFNVEVGDYKFNGTLSYIDSWGGNREIQLTVPVTVLGRAGYIEVAVNKSVSVKSRYVNTTLTIVNHGSTPMYDAYIVVSPYQGNPTLIASPAVNYIHRINPDEPCTIPLTLAYNPLGFYTQTGAASYITYGPVPLMVSVVYRDASGYYRTFNNSVTIVVEPFIELVIRSVKATGTNVSSTVTGTIINYGSSTAYRVEVELKIGDTAASENIGDIGPGEEIAFRVDINEYNENAILTVRYYNIFNEEESKEISVTIAKREEAVSPTAEEEKWPIERWVIVAGVIVFLVVSILLIYRMMKKTRIEGSMPPEMMGQR
ncbi:hypothetical protein KEJ24_03930 [Candidatus Bathyarchaeota archaeon]|nr:hypothetical protein [Candidatus Bathyarchaeota archaeon]